MVKALKKNDPTSSVFETFNLGSGHVIKLPKDSP